MSGSVHVRVGGHIFSSGNWQTLPLATFTQALSERAVPRLGAGGVTPAERARQGIVALAVERAALARQGLGLLAARGDERRCDDGHEGEEVGAPAVRHETRAS
jgi:hypothetical protein